MSRKFNSVWPPPVYCAQFDDGAVIRMSFSTPVNKPVDFERGRRLCCAIKGDDIAAQKSAEWRQIRRWGMSPTANDFRRLEDAGYFGSTEYRHMLRQVAQSLVDAAVSVLCGTPMPQTRKRVKCFTDTEIVSNREWIPGKVIRDKDGNIMWKTVTLGYSSVPLFRAPLPKAPPAVAVVGWVERDGERIPDPYFTPADTTSNVVEMPKRRTLSPFQKALALLEKLTDEERASLAARIAA